LNKKILVIGAGFLGSNIVQKIKTHTIIQTNLTKVKNSYTLDITDSNKVIECFNDIKPNIVINCAANTKIDFLEKNAHIAYSINGVGARNVAIAAEKFSARLVHISTDGVFDGIRGNYTEDDKPNPVNIYAKSKLFGEKYVINNCSNYVVIRTNFYGYHPQNKFLFNSILSKLKKNEQIIGFNDVIFNPLEVSNLSQLISEIAFSDYVGILNLSSNEPITKYQFCYRIAKAFDLDTTLIIKGSIDDAHFIAKRPKNTSLVNIKSKQITKSKIISLTEWLLKIRDMM
jgi:dTDP-4-dehydrorhamnose reductase